MKVSMAYRLMVLAMVVAISATSFGQSPASLAAADTGVTHQQVVSRGVGKSVRVKEVNGTTVAGKITAIDGDAFEVTPGDGAKAVRIRNDEVAKVENGGMRRGVKIAIIVVVVLVVAGIAGTRV